MVPFLYNLPYPDLNMREQPHLYRIGRGEQGVLLVQPYKSEILPHWRFRNPSEALLSASSILSLYCRYALDGDFPGADMSRKFLQMGFTRARRYANHPDGTKYDRRDGSVRPVSPESLLGPKALSASIFRSHLVQITRNDSYKAARSLWREYENSVARLSDSLPVPPIPARLHGFLRESGRGILRGTEFSALANGTREQSPDPLPVPLAAAGGNL
jgi:hypothetical protein